MLSISLTQAKRYTKTPKLLAIDSDGEDVYYVPERNAPAQRIDDPFSLVDDETLFRIKKKYSVSRRIINRLKKSYREKSEFIDLGGSPDLSTTLAIAEIENSIITKLKHTYYNPHASLDPHIPIENSKNTASHMAIIGSSGSGKTTWLMRHVLFLPNFKQRKIYIFSAHVNDPSILHLRDNLPNAKKLLVVLDLKRVEADEYVPDLYEFAENSIIIFDDISSLSNASKGNYNLKRVLFQFLTSILESGRHRGQTACYIGHSLYLNALTKAIKAESAFVVYLHRYGLKNQFARYLNSLGLSKAVIQKQFELAAKSRWICLANVAPIRIISQHHVSLI